MKILLHSSKTIRPVSSDVHELTTPQFLKQARNLNRELIRLNQSQIETLMDVSPKLANKVMTQAANWTNAGAASPAALAFRGDIYSGLSAAAWSKDDAAFAQKNLILVSGLYGLLKPFDQIAPYRLEVGYKLALAKHRSLYEFWKEQLDAALDPEQTYINLTANEYYKVVAPQLHASKVISPKFLTVSNKTKLPVFVTVHAKVARGSFANWLITNRIDKQDALASYSQLNYVYDESLSSELAPVFVCREFGGLGLSVRLK